MTLSGEFWKVHGTDHIIPAGMSCPEGFEPGKLIREIAGEGAQVVEIGCGIGRLAGAFDPDHYEGVDINEVAVMLAQAQHPNHTFRTIMENAYYPWGDVVFLYTVALHVEDGAIFSVLERASAAAMQKLIIAEIMDRKWRREGTPPVFNRDPGEYVKLMEQLDFRLAEKIIRPYAHYANHWMYKASGKDTNITILVFDKNQETECTSPTTSPT